jgi:hypothetical protein
MDTIIFVTATVVAIMASLYLFAQSQVSYLKKHWVEYRCNPMYMPVAGLVGDDVLSNFTKCTMKGFHDYAGFIMDPIIAEFSIINDTVSTIGDTMNSFRSMFSSTRSGMLGIVGSVFGKIHNVMAQTQYTVIRMRTILARVVGVMYSFVYIFYSGVQTGEATVNGPVGSVMSFLCFDENTEVRTFKGVRALKHVEIGDRLLDNFAHVTSIYKIDGTGIPMYSLSGVLVTGNHKVKRKGKFIRVDQHPLAKKINKESKTLVCLNTTSHKISIKNFEFLDFVESDDTTFADFKHRYIEMLYNGEGTKKFNGMRTGVSGDTLVKLKDGTDIPISRIDVGNVLQNGDIVKALCVHKVDGNMYSIVNGIITTPNTWVYKDNKVYKAADIGEMSYIPEQVYIYQLITESSIYSVGSNKSQIYLLDELETTEPYYHSLKDSIITTGRFRSKIIVV